MTAAAWAIGPGASWERVRSALEERGLIARIRGDRHADARCPAHDDGRASLTADYQPGEPGRVLLCCHTGCEFADIVAALGLREADTFDGPPPEGSRRRGGPVSRPRAAARPAASAARVKCDHRWTEVEAYRYTDADGEVVCEVVRQACGQCGGKNFPVRRPDGRGGWEWKWPAVADRPLYRLPAVLAAVALGRTVYIAEGEKDVHALERTGLVATCNPGGAGKFRASHAKILAGAARVVIVADRDAAGYKHAAAVAAALAAVKPPPGAVEIIEAAEGKDAADHLGAGRAVADFAPVDPQARLAELDSGVTPIGSRRLARVGQAGDVAGRDRGDGGKPRALAKWIAVEGSLGWEYRAPDGDDPGAVAQWTGRGDDRELTEVLSWAPEIRGRLVTEGDDGQATGRHFELRVGEDTRVVSNADLRSGEAWDKFPDATGDGSKKVREVLHNIVTGQARRQPRTLAALRTGWHEQDGGRFYLYPDGRTFPPDGRRVRLIGAPAKLAVAARPLEVTASASQIRQALDDIREHGRGPALFNLAAGARSLAQSLMPVRAALALVGPQNAGKSSAAAHGRGLVLTRRPDPFPFIPTKNFASTRTDLEFAVNFEADMPQVIEDLALSGDAPAAEIREAVGKLEALIRPVANDDEIRGRRTRDLMPGPANYVRSIPGMTAQALPAGMQSSLYRRAVVWYMREGDVDTTWYAPESLGGGGGGHLLAVPLRTLGDLIIARLYEHGDDLERVLTGYGAEAYRFLVPAMDAALPGWSLFGDGTTGIVRSAAGMLGGLALVAEVAEGTGFAELAEPVLAPLAASLAEQASKMADRQAAADSLADAVSRVITAALLGRRAHICGKDGRPAPLMPGLAPSEQGLRDVGGFSGMGWEGFGVPLFWLPDRGGVGIRSESLHSLMVASGDPRALGLTPRSLPPALLRDGVSIRNDTQADRAAVHEIRFGDSKARVILLRPEVITGELEPKLVTPYRVISVNGDNGDNGDSAGQRLESEPRRENQAKNGDNAGQGRETLSQEPAAVEPGMPLSSAVPVVAVVPRGTGTTAGSAVRGGRFAAPAVVADAEGAWLAVTDRVEVLELPRLDGLADVLGWARTLSLGVANPDRRGQDDDALVAICPGLRARLGLPASPPERGSKAASEYPALASLRSAGWRVAGLSSWMSVWRQGEDTVRLWVPEWDDPRECPLWGEEGTDAVTLAYRLGLFAEMVGISWRLTGGTTGIDLAASFSRKKLRLEAADPPKPALVPVLESDFCWSRKPMSEESGLGWLHFYDMNAMYLPAYQAPVNCGGWRSVEAPAFDPKLPGYWRLAERPDPPGWLLPDVLNPTARDTGGRHGGWFTTPALARAAELGADIRPLEAHLPASDNHGRWYGPWYERLRDARAALTGRTDEDSAAVLAALKMVWRKTHGQVAPVKRPASATPRYRPDHRHMIIATARANLDRRAAKVGEVAGRWPLAILTDGLAYASADPDPRSACPAGLVLGAGLGEFKHSGTLPMSAAVPLLGTGGTKNVGALFDAAHDWWEENHGA